MTAEPEVPTEPRAWQDVARDNGFTLHVLGVLLDRKFQTMRAYSTGIRPIPQSLLDRMTVIFREPVR